MKQKETIEVASAPSLGTISPAAETTPVRLRDITMGFGEKTVLDNVNLEVPAGEFLGLIGPSGAGKSTLLRLINGTHKPLTGDISVLGINPADCTHKALQELRTKIGFIFQQFGLVGRLSAMENVLMGSLGQLKLPRYGIATYPRILRERAAEALDRVGLIEERFQRCDTLSGGQQQRVAIARALMQDAQLILADEPVASLDPAASQSVLEVLKKISAEDGFTVICSLHQVDLALEIADRIVAVREGKFILDTLSRDTNEQEIRSVYAAAKAD